MPNLKSAIKHVKTSTMKQISSNEYRSSMKTAIKKLNNAIKSNNKQEAIENLTIAIKRIDKAVKKGAIHANKGNRNKSRLTTKVNTMK